MKKIATFIFVIIIMLTAVSLTACGGTEIDLKSYTTVTFKGVDGNATATINFDMVAFEKAYSIANGSSFTFSEKALENISKLVPFSSSLDFEVTPSYGLSNGEEVTVNFTYNKSAAKDAKLNLKNTTYKITVEGLTEAIEVDAFDPAVFNTDTGVMIMYTDIFPNGFLLISNKVDKTNPISQVNYTAESNGVSYGEKITITASLSEDAVANGYVLKEETYDYPIKDIDHMLISTDELTSDDKNALKTKYESIIKGLDSSHFYDADGTWYYIFGGKVKNAHIGDLYLLKKNDGTYEKKAFISVYADIISSIDDVTCNNSVAYYSVGDLYIKGDGTLNYSASSYNTDFYATEEVADKMFWKDYTVNYNIEKVTFE
ncbi:MAG: hypothetical protein IJT27_04130 [Clostridia bacterium]|nr:hypothetical protein [Clostridia bacterium]